MYDGANTRLSKYAIIWHSYADVCSTEKTLKRARISGAVGAAREEHFCWAYFTWDETTGETTLYAVGSPGDDGYGGQLWSRASGFRELYGDFPDTKHYVPDHEYEPTDDAEEVRTRLLREEGMVPFGEVVMRLWKTCKGCKRIVQEKEDEEDEEACEEWL